MNRVQRILVAFTALTVTGGGSPKVDHVSSRSPISWQAVEAKSGLKVNPIRYETALGVSLSPTSVTSAMLRDQRSYGGEEQRAISLACYESVPVAGAKDGTRASVTLYLAFDETSGDLECAFTPSAPYWARPPDINAMSVEASIAARWNTSRAEHGNLKSAPVEVLAALWSHFGVDPSKSGQIIIRPRYVAEKEPSYDVDGKLVAQDGPANVWIVEVLGTVVARRRLFGEDRLLTTRVDLFRDGDLKYLGGVIAP